MTATNAYGTDSDSATVNVTDINPPVVTGVTELSNLNGTVELQGTATNSPTSWNWTIPGADTITGASTATPTATFSANGTYNGTVTATNADGTSAPFAFTITITDLP